MFPRIPRATPHVPGAPASAAPPVAVPPTGIKAFFCERVEIDGQKMYRRIDTGEMFEPGALPIGALWYGDGAGYHHGFDAPGPDGKALVAKCPGDSMWCIDARASNCDMPKDQAHRCWVRHGDPKTGNVQVDKNGKTCGAGGGSIQTHNWHGFLHNGVFHT